ncbi:hypothetical protein C8R44DRAFT_748959 [Mycena epipterygia]|nr:hypothetical protein C8R44DRAFT_748959 [Mycena epipterygia]
MPLGGFEPPPICILFNDSNRWSNSDSGRRRSHSWSTNLLVLKEKDQTYMFMPSGGIEPPTPCAPWSVLLYHWGDSDNRRRLFLVNRFSVCVNKNSNIHQQGCEPTLRNKTKTQDDHAFGSIRTSVPICIPDHKKLNRWGDSNNRRRLIRHLFSTQVKHKYLRESESRLVHINMGVRIDLRNIRLGCHIPIIDEGVLYPVQRVNI